MPDKFKAEIRKTAMILPRVVAKVANQTPDGIAGYHWPHTRHLCGHAAGFDDAAPTSIVRNAVRRRC